MFTAFLRAGVPFEQLDRRGTKDLWCLYKQKGLDVKKVDCTSDLISLSDSLVPIALPPPVSLSLPNKDLYDSILAQAKLTQ